MRITHIPKINPLGLSVDNLTPSTYASIQNGCAFPQIVKAAIRTGNFDYGMLLPRSPKAIRGTIIHKLFELRVKGEIQTEDDYLDSWEQYISQEEAKLKRQYPTLRNLSIEDIDKQYESCDAAMQMQPIVLSYNKPNSLRNRSLEVPVMIEGVLKGKIDRVVRKDGIIELIDYKSGNAYDENGVVKEDYVVQLNLYALCFENVFNEMVNKLTIVQTSDLLEIDVPIEREKFVPVIEEIKSLILSINEHIQQNRCEDLQKPSENICKYCDCRHFCQSYLNSDFRSPYIVDGKVTEVVPHNFIKLQDNESNLISISRLDDFELDDWNSLIGKHLLFVDVSSRIENVYKRIDRTIVFEIED